MPKQLTGNFVAVFCQPEREDCGLKLRATEQKRPAGLLNIKFPRGGGRMKKLTNNAAEYGGASISHAGGSLVYCKSSRQFGAGARARFQLARIMRRRADEFDIPSLRIRPYPRDPSAELAKALIRNDLPI